MILMRNVVGWSRLVVGIAAFGAGMAHAQLAQNLLIGNAKALSLGNAVTADPPGIDSVHYNPAGLSRLHGTQTMLKVITADVGIIGEFNSNPFYDCLFEPNTPECPKDFAQITTPDPVRNTKSKVEKFAIYTPGKGITELPFIAAPLGGASYQPPESKLTFATDVYAPLILGYVRSPDDPGRFYGQELGLTRITYFAPTVSWQYNEKLSLGFGVGLSYFGAGLKLDYRAPNAAVGGISQLTSSQCPTGNPLEDPGKLNLLCANINPFDKLFTLEADVNVPYSPTVNVGALWEATDWLTLGVVYQSEAADRLTGDITVDIAPNLTQFILNAEQANGGALAGAVEFFTGINARNNGKLLEKGHLDVTIPQHFAVGASIQITPRWKANIDWKWTQTSAWNNLTFVFDEQLPILATLSPIAGVDSNALVIPRGYKDASNFAFGVEYEYSDRIAFRAGYEPRKEGIPKDKLDFLIPLGDMDLYGLGASIKLTRASVFDVALGYVKSDQNIPHGSSTNGNDTRADNFVYNPSAGLDVRSTLTAYLVEVSYQVQY